MKQIIAFSLIFIGAIQFSVMAQEKHGSTLNLGIGVAGYSGYYSYVAHSLPVLHVDYEFDVVKNFTLAPFVNFYTYANVYVWGDANNPVDNYTYREIVIPVGIKGTYYFDELFRASSKWDFYAAGSLGFSLVKRHWEAGYNGNTNYYRGANPLFLDAHIGAEYHFSYHWGVFLDVSTGVSTIGLTIH